MKMVNYIWSIISVFAKTGELHEPRVHQLFRTKDGWLVAAPFATDGETLKEDGYSEDEIQGTFYLVNHGTDISDKVHKPQKIQLNADGTVTGEELEGAWKQKKAHHILMWLLVKILIQELSWK